MPDRVPDFQEWTGRVLAAAAPFPGHEGATLVGPPHREPGRRMLILRFSDRNSLRRWHDSDERKLLTAQADAFSKQIYDEPCSLETWFAIPGMGSVEPPPRWKMALVTTPAAYVVITVILSAISALEPIGESWPGAAMNGVVTVLMVVFLTFLVMPIVTRLLRRWLYPQATQTGSAGHIGSPQRNP